MIDQLEIGDQPIDLAEIVAASAGATQIRLSLDALARVAASRAVVEAYAEGDEPVYGLNTGLGGNLGFRLDTATLADFQVQMIRGRTIGVGPLFSQGVGRIQLLCRIIGLAQGGAGISPAVLDGMIAMFNRGVTPCVPGRGSIGAGDLGLAAHIGAVVIGHGQAWFDGQLLPGAEALAAAGLSRVALGAKDGLGLLNTSAISCGHAAVVLAELADLLIFGTATAALSLEGYAANPGIFDARLAVARPAGGQVRAAAMFRQLLAGSYLYDGSSRSIQDALSFRVLSQIYGPVLTAFDTAAEAVTLEINTASDNPLVLADDRTILSTANYHTPAIALAFDSLAIALCHLASASIQRTVKLMDARLSGLPKYLSPVGGPSVGFNALQKTASYLHAEIRLKATPASLDSIPVSETVEDHAPHTPLTIRKLEEQLLPLRLLIAIEAMTAAQAVDLRGKPILSVPTAILYAAIRARVPKLDEDRETGPDVDLITAIAQDGALLTALRMSFRGLSLNPLLADA
ncbi:histidine ammonia-lyase [Acidisoma cellulosilytica]|uniref:Histidine ammonia-lyase n=1 Tax=Acidisoma cellulosilyticum TaxID=2802395 RepID=A0A964E6L9_9PROT|nr:aromatic amino acid ammonia-lyase [Acidisoma cellulosilyticum]MCB8883905.1 histidine ammonia-lyase [Acidisoma cellulosilyticum]